MNSRLVLLLLRPSIVSGMATLTAAAAVIGAANWTYITYTSGLYDFFFGRSGLVTALEAAPDLEAPTAAAQSPLYVIMVAVIAVGGGILVFSLLHFIHGLMRRASEHQTTQLEIYRRRVLRQEFGSRLLSRALILVCWVGYMVVFLQWMVPYGILWSRVGAEDLMSTEGWIQNGTAFALIAIGLHIHIIMARLFVMRPRVFGGEAAIEDALSGR
ncbi:MAG TPA: hypothetical protein VLA88_03540 [Candidatus Saccharimonadales bacterium]|nr:hypothetical protein [Candidatus Saccharimonadales bacterium]